MKKLIWTSCFLLALSACGDTTTPTEEKTVQPPAQTTTSEIDLNFDGTTYQYNKDNLSETCQATGQIACAIEKVVKCALKPTANYCDKKNMPDFIFYDDAMFADDNGLGRPTQQSFKLIKYKTIDNQTIEVFTEGTCDKNWFGNCAGNIIYVMSNASGQWLVKELYALENI